MTEQNTVDPTVVTMDNGEVINFGARARLISAQTIRENGFDLTFHVKSGKSFVYSFNSANPISKFVLELAAFGAASKAKAATASAKSIEQIETIVETKIEEFNAENFVTRSASTNSLTLNLYQEAYADVNGIDKTDPRAVAGVKEHFSFMTAEDRSALAKMPAIRVAVSKIRLAQAIAEMEAAGVAD